MSDEEKLNAIRESLTKFDDKGTRFYENGTTNVFAFYRERISYYKTFVALKETIRKDLIATKERVREDIGLPTPTAKEVEDLEALFFLIKKLD